MLKTDTKYAAFYMLSVVVGRVPPRLNSTKSPLNQPQGAPMETTNESVRLSCKQCGYPLEWDKCDHPACVQAKELGFCQNGCRIAWYRLKEIIMEKAAVG